MSVSVTVVRAVTILATTSVVLVVARVLRRPNGSGGGGRDNSEVGLGRLALGLIEVEG